MPQPGFSASAWSRSREGAWIEIQSRAHPSTWPHSRSREGAWIEMPVKPLVLISGAVAPVRERGLKYGKFEATNSKNAVAPVRERGLKYYNFTLLPSKSGRSREGAWIEIPC